MQRTVFDVTAQGIVETRKVRYVVVPLGRTKRVVARVIFQHQPEPGGSNVLLDITGNQINGGRRHSANLPRPCITQVDLTVELTSTVKPVGITVALHQLLEQHRAGQVELYRPIQADLSKRVEIQVQIAEQQCPLVSQPVIQPEPQMADTCALTAVAGCTQADQRNITGQYTLILRAQLLRRLMKKQASHCQPGAHRRFSNDGRHRNKAVWQTGQEPLGLVTSIVRVKNIVRTQLRPGTATHQKCRCCDQAHPASSLRLIHDT